MEIKEILEKIENTQIETQQQHFELGVLKAQINAIGVLVSALGNIEADLIGIDDRLKRLADF